MMKGECVLIKFSNSSLVLTNILFLMIAFFLLSDGFDCVKTSYKKEKKSFFSFLYDTFDDIVQIIGGIAGLLSVVLLVCYFAGLIDINMYKNLVSVCCVVEGVILMISWGGFSFSLGFSTLLFSISAYYSGYLDWFMTKN